MNLSELCIRRPVFATMLVLFPVAAGLISYQNIGVDLLPNVDLPIITISTARAGTSVEEMESGVTKVIEDAVNTLAGIDELRSTTKEGTSNVTVQFVLEKSRDVAQQEVQGKINAAIRRLPVGTDTPIVDKRDLNADAVLKIAVSGKRNLRELTEIADREIRDALSSLKGVGAVNRIGGQKRAINVTVDAKRLEGYGLSIEQVRQALSRQNLEEPGGRIDQPGREPVLRTTGRVSDTADFNRIINANVGGRPLRIEDVGAAEDSIEESRALGRLDGDPSIILEVQKQSGTNTVQVVDTVKDKLDDLMETFRESGRTDLRIQVIRDQSVFINGSLHEVKKHLLMGAILVALTILLFLRDWRTMLIASLSIPVSLISTFLVMDRFGFTLNNITMLALVMAVGVVIDDAVVVHENIFRWIEEKGVSAWDAALGATKEIALAVMATTMSLVVIFLPIAFMSGRVGKFFYSFGITMAVAILMSMLVSFTLTPMLASRFLKLKARSKDEAAAHHSGGVYGWLVEKPYLALLEWSLQARWVVVVCALLVTATLLPMPWLGYPGLVKLVGMDLFPQEDQSEFSINASAPPDWSLERVSSAFSEIEDKVRAMPEVAHVMTSIGDTSGRSARGGGDVTQGNIYVKLIELDERKKDANGHRFTQFDVMRKARGLMSNWPDLRSSVSGGGGGGGGREVEFNLIGPDMNRLSDLADNMLGILRKNPGLVDVDTTLALRKAEVRVEVDRDRASEQGIPVQTVASTLRTLVGGEIVSDYRDESVGELYDVWLRARGVDRADRTAIGRLTVPTAGGKLIPLESIANLSDARGPAQIDRYSRLRNITLVANLNNMPLSDAVVAFKKAAEEVKLPADYTLVQAGRAKTQAEANTGFLAAFALSAIFMYMILAAQFESFALPVAILTAIPMTIPCALVSLLLLGDSLNINSILGIFLLFGIVKKNGILQVDYTNVLRRQAAANPESVPEPERGSPVRVRNWALVEANRVRLRPILMTTLMLMASMTPIAMGTGPGSARRASIAKVIVGGQALSLLLSLLATPVAYALLDDLRPKRREQKAGSLP